MTRKTNNIQEFELSASAKAGVFIVKLQDRFFVEGHDTTEPHRDDHYVLVLATHGRYRVNLDFNDIDVGSPSLLIVGPGQVHHMVEMTGTKGWIINFDPAILDADLQQAFESGSTPVIRLEQDGELRKQLSDILTLVGHLVAGMEDLYTTKCIHALLTAFAGLVAGKLVRHTSAARKSEGRSFDIKLSFVTLLKKHYKTWKEPSQYADALSISIAHLNFCVKSTTGIPVSRHIQLHSILEAKRLLYYTQYTASEVGYEVGYQEPVYFGKLFRKITGVTPMQFRQQFRSHP